jgi:hypothetical protein
LGGGHVCKSCIRCIVLGSSNAISKCPDTSKFEANRCHWQMD